MVGYIVTLFTRILNGFIFCRMNAARDLRLVAAEGQLSCVDTLHVAPQAKMLGSSNQAQNAPLRLASGAGVRRGAKHSIHKNYISGALHP